MCVLVGSLFLTLWKFVFIFPITYDREECKIITEIQCVQYSVKITDILFLGHPNWLARVTCEKLSKPIGYDACKGSWRTRTIALLLRVIRYQTRDCCGPAANSQQVSGVWVCAYVKKTYVRVCAVCACVFNHLRRARYPCILTFIRFQVNLHVCGFFFVSQFVLIFWYFAAPITSCWILRQRSKTFKLLSRHNPRTLFCLFKQTQSPTLTWSRVYEIY